MHQDDLVKLAEGKNWIEEIVVKSRDIQVPLKFSFLKRRIYQLRCAILHSGDASPKLHKLIIRYLLGSSFIAYLLFKSKLVKKKKLTSFSIWDSNIDPHVSCNIFNDFIKSKQIISLAKDEVLIVNSDKSTDLFANIFYTRIPIYDTLNFIDVSFMDSFKLLLNIYKNLFTYLRVSLSCPGSNGLFKDFLTEPLIKLYLQKGLNKFYRTNSSMSSQEFWCESIDFNTVWYSTNSRTFQYKNTSIGIIPEYPLFYFMHFGTSWTWNKTNADWLQKFQEHKVNIVGPIMFYFLSPNQPQKNASSKKILIFDVTPYEEAYIQKQHFQKGLNYYSEKNCIKFISDVLLSVENKDWEIILKPKRHYSNFHSKKYIDFLEQLKILHPNFKILSAKCNLFDEIKNSNLVINIPLSSPFDIAKSLNIPTIYFDPTGDIDFRAMGYTDLDFACTSAILREKVQSLQ